MQAVHVGKYLEVELSGNDREGARKAMSEACQKFLTNPVIEEYQISMAN